MAFRARRTVGRGSLRCLSIASRDEGEPGGGADGGFGGVGRMKHRVEGCDCKRAFLRRRGRYAVGWMIGFSWLEW